MYQCAVLTEIRWLVTILKRSLKQLLGETDFRKRHEVKPSLKDIVKRSIDNPIYSSVVSCVCRIFHQNLTLVFVLRNCCTSTSWYVIPLTQSKPCCLV